MRPLTALAAGLVLVFGGLLGGGNAAADPADEYICSMSVTPASQSVTVGQSAYFSVQRNICSRSTGQFLYTSTEGTYWSSSDTYVASVGSAGNNATMNVTVSTLHPGSATITAIALCCSYDYTEVRASGTLTVNPPPPPPFSVSIYGQTTVQSNYGGYCNWYASTTSGTQPFSYQWYRSGALVSTSSNYYSNYIYFTFPLSVTVTDAYGHVVSDSKIISVTQSYYDHC